MLNNVNMKLEYPCSALIKGRNGSGKTTITRLVCDMLQPTNGSILLNGKPINNIMLASYSNKIAICKTPILFEGMSIIDSLLMLSEKDASTDYEYKKELALILCKEFDLIDDLEALPQGINTILSETIALSSGQLQKMLLVRMLMSDADILIFDEPTSHLDASSTKSFFNMVDSLRHNHIILVITHETGFEHNFDHVFELTNKTIEEKLTHDFPRTHSK